ncbi:MAG: polysaccharide deacetylase family protein [Bacteroidetes bacterium]|nr:polysaccharide deacetylase family protein [Bacteroidota bacterium]
MKFYLLSALYVLIIALAILFPIERLETIIIVSGVSIVFIAIIVWASVNINSQFYVKTICRSNKKNMIAITFDDGPDTKNTMQILDILDDYNAKATFFVIGEKAEENSGLVKLIHDSGHQVANHSYSHSYFFPLKRSKTIREEINSTQSIIQKITGEKSFYFRPPFGVTNPLIAKALKGLNIKTIGWSIRSFDTVQKDAEKTITRIKKRIKGGDIILLHDTGGNIIPMLKKLLEIISHNSLIAVRVDELLKK